jgi:hypothetical protein
MMKSFTLLPLAIGAVGLAACASPTPFERASGTDETGYASSQLSTDRYRVSFEGNQATSRETVETYLLYRAAQIADRENSPYFVVSARDVDAQLDVDRYRHAYTTTPGLFGYGYSYAYPYYTTSAYGPGYGGFAAPTTVDVDDSYEAAAIIELYDSRPMGRENVFETADVLTRLDAKVRRPQ